MRTTIDTQTFSKNKPKFLKSIQDFPVKIRDNITKKQIFYVVKINCAKDT